MRYQVKISKGFWESAKKLKQKYTNEEFSDIIDEIRESIILLANDGKLPEEYQDHILRRSPYLNHHEYHLYDDDVLVIYVRNENHLYLRFVEVTDHATLNKNSN